MKDGVLAITIAAMIFAAIVTLRIEIMQVRNEFRKYRDKRKKENHYCDTCGYLLTVYCPYGGSKPRNLVGCDYHSDLRDTLRGPK